MRRSWFVTTFNPKCTLGWASIVCMPHDPCNKFKLKFKRIILTIFAYSYLRWLCKVLLSVDAWIASVKFPTLWKNLQEFILITVWKGSPSLLIIFWWWRWRFLPHTFNENKYNSRGVNYLTLTGSYLQRLCMYHWGFMLIITSHGGR